MMAVHAPRMPSLRVLRLPSAASSPPRVFVMPSQILGLLFLLYTTAAGFVIDSRLDLPAPTGFKVDSSLSPKIVKAFYEINFVPVSSPVEAGRPQVSVLEPSLCGHYGPGLCKSYYIPASVSVKVGEVKRESKKDVTTEVPIIKGLETTEKKVSKNDDVPILVGLSPDDEEKLLKDISPLIKINNKKTTVVRPEEKKKDDDEVPIIKGLTKKEDEGKAAVKAPLDTRRREDDLPTYRGTVDVESVLRSPERPDYREQERPARRHCFQGACWVNYY